MIWAFIVVGLCVYFTWRTFFEEKNPLDDLPGRPKLPFFGNAFDFLFIPIEKVVDVSVRYTEAYGDRFVVKIPNLYVLAINNPDDIEVLLTDTKNITKGLGYTFLKSWLGTGILTSTGALWHKRRKILTPTFHFNILKNFAPVIEEKSRGIVYKLKQIKGEDVDVLSLISDFTLYTICETAMGTRFDSDKSEEIVEYKNTITEIGKLMMNRTMQVWLHNEYIFNILPIGKRFARTLQKVQSFADAVILDRKKKTTEQSKEQITAEVLDAEDLGTKRRLALLDLLLEAEEAGQIDIKGIRDEVNTFMFEGHDTTAHALTYCLMLLAEHDEVQEKVYEECQRIFGSVTRTANMSDLMEMKYLEAVIKETLRMYPSVPFIGREITEDFMMRDLLVKKGTQVIIQIYNLHYREDLYPEPRVFKPERFFGEEARHPFAYLPFSAGLRNCIGQRFAMQEMKCMLSEICRSFKLVPKTKGFIPAVKNDMVLRPTEPIYIQFVPR